jgi:hypothetical protein
MNLYSILVIRNVSTHKKPLVAATFTCISLYPRFFHFFSEILINQFVIPNHILWTGNCTCMMWFPPVRRVKKYICCQNVSPWINSDEECREDLLLCVFCTRIYFQEGQYWACVTSGYAGRHVWLYESVRNILVENSVFRKLSYTPVSKCQ